MRDDQRPPKRTRADDEASLPEHPSISKTLDNVKRDPDLWLEDGNIVLVARDAAFFVYRGLLVKQSTVFADMFATGTPTANESLDGCPVVRLPDVPVDLKHLLHFLMPSAGIRLPDHKRPIVFPELFAVIRLTHKYNIEDVLEQALHILKLFYTTSFRQYECKAYSHVNFIQPKPVHHIGAVNLARLTNIPSILPFALYRCCGLSGRVMDGWKRDTGETEYLRMQDIRAIITRRDELAQKDFTMMLNIFDDDPSYGCTQRSLCETSLRGIIRNLEWPVGQYNVLHSWAPEIKQLAKELGICKQCQDALLKRDVAERQDVWEDLPLMFGLSTTECQWDKAVGGDQSSSDSDSY